MRAIVVGVALAACGRSDFDAVPDGTVTTTDASVRSCPTDACPSTTLCASDQLCHPILFQDTFDSATIDPSWSLMRFVFTSIGTHLQTTATIRPGFNYGQGGNGRSAVAALHIGDTTWTDLRIQWTQQSQASLLIVDGSLPACQHTPSVMFHIADYQESWNAPEDTDQGFTIDQGCLGPEGPTGSWGLGGASQSWIPGTGWSPNQVGVGYVQTSGLEPITDTPLPFVIELRGSRVQIWVSDALVVDFDDSTYTYPTGTIPPRYGGVAFSSAWEQMFWIDDVVIADLTKT